MIRSRHPYTPCSAGFWPVVVLLLILPTTGVAEDAPADSLLVDLPDLVVQAEGSNPPAPSRTRIETAAIEVRDPGSLASLGVLLPSTRVATNSRGDSHAMVRGAPERHVQTFLDGIPLNVPWDERVDLETVPALGIGRIEGRRGPVTLLDGPGVLAGSVRILPPGKLVERRATRVAAALGQHGAGRAEIVHRQHQGSWNLMGAGAWMNRDAWPLPHSHPEAASEELRQNSDLQQFSVLLRGARPVKGSGRLSLLATGWTGEKGVPPELHLGEDARFWRYPVRERALLGAVLDLPLDDAGNFDLGATVSADFFHQEIDPRGPDGWDQPQLEGQDYEKNYDRTGYGRVRLTRWLGDTASLAVQGSARYTHHRESTTVGGATQAYAQWLTSLTAESEFLPADHWTIRAGLGWDHAATPESGDKAGKDPDHALAANLRVMRAVSDRTGIYAAASRRSRFPSLRELYSGALGRFVANPGLKPESQDMIELGTTAAGDRWRLECAAFVSWLRDGIEKVVLPGPERRFMRVNRTEIRVPGLELVGGWTLRPDLELSAQHTILDAHVLVDDQPDRPAEDRPAYQSLAALDWRPSAGPGALVEAQVTGPRWSADQTAVDGLRHLPAGVIWNLRLSWRWPAPSTAAAGVEAHLRVDNLFDQLLEFQTGLPESGRVVSGGFALTL